MSVKLAFHDADTDTDTDILARIVARMSACRSACHRYNFRKSRVSDVSARILARTSVSVSASWNASLTRSTVTTCHPRVQLGASHLVLLNHTRPDRRQVNHLCRSTTPLHSMALPGSRPSQVRCAVCIIWKLSLRPTRFVFLCQQKTF